MTTHLTPISEVSPFDSIRKIDESGQEYWSARDLMPLLGYNSRWNDFKLAVERAIVAIEAQGIDLGQHIVAVQSARKAMAGFGERTYTREDFKLTRYGAYHVALSGDPRKPEVAAAIRYFVVKTREAEIIQHEIPRTYAAALKAAADQAHRAELAEAMSAELDSKVTYLKPRALTAELAEDNHGGQLVWEMREAVAARIGISPQDVLSTLESFGAIRRSGVGKSKHWVAPSWQDLLFPSAVRSIDTARQRDVVYHTGPVRVRDGKQVEFLDRVSEVYQGRVTRIRPEGIDACVTTTDLAPEIGIGPYALRDHLREWGWMRDHGTAARSFAVEQGFMKNDNWELETGEIKTTGKVTPKGRDEIIRRLKGDGVFV